MVTDSGGSGYGHASRRGGAAAGDTTTALNETPSPSPVALVTASFLVQATTNSPGRRSAGSAASAARSSSDITMRARESALARPSSCSTSIPTGAMATATPTISPECVTESWTPSTTGLPCGLPQRPQVRSTRIPATSWPVRSATAALASAHPTTKRSLSSSLRYACQRCRSVSSSSPASRGEASWRRAHHTRAIPASSVI